MPSWMLGLPSAHRAVRTGSSSEEDRQLAVVVDHTVHVHVGPHATLDPQRARVADAAREAQARADDIACRPTGSRGPQSRCRRAAKLPGIMPTPTLCEAMPSTLTGAPLSAHTVM